MKRIRIHEVVVVEGKYDATAVAGLIDGLILTTDGFTIFSDDEKKSLLQKLGKERGLLILTDSDSAGFQIRHYIEKIAKGAKIKHAYIPSVYGKESRKKAPSKEGTLGVEGLPPEMLLQALEQAGIQGEEPKEGPEITYADLYELGLSGGAGSAIRRRELLKKLNLPSRLSKRALKQVLSSLYSLEELHSLVWEKPVLFWDFHGTLTLPDVNWFAAALESAKEQVPNKPLDPDILVRNFDKTCLPWWSIPSGDTRHLTKEGAWWRHCEEEFIAMFQRCGFSRKEAACIAPEIRQKILEPKRYTLADGVKTTLEELKNRGYHQFVLSNNFPELEEIIVGLGLESYFEKILVSGKIGYDKPRKEIFEKALLLAGNPRNPWMIGDNPRDDIAGAASMGFTTVLVNGSTDEYANYNITTVLDLLEILT